MTILIDVTRLIARLAPATICDDCISDKLGLGDRLIAEQASREVAGSNGFERKKDLCSLCDALKLVISKVH